MLVTGTLAGQKKWYKRHAHTIIIVALAIIGLSTLSLIAVAVQSSSAATRQQQLITDRRYEIRKSLQAFSDETTKQQAATPTGAAEINQRLVRLRDSLEKQQLQPPGTLPFSEVVSASMKKAVGDTNATNAAVKDLIATIKALEAAADYQDKAAKVLQSNLRSDQLNSEESAIATSRSWQKIASELEKLTPIQEFSDTHAKLIKASKDIAAYCMKVAGYYKASDNTALQSAQSGLDDVYNELRKVSTESEKKLEPISGELGKRAAVFLSQ